MPLLAPPPTILTTLAERLHAEVAPTADLREDGGNLSAKRVADVFGLTLTQLATLLNRPKQTVSKTPDAEALQAGLRAFGRIAALRQPLGGDVAFRKWLRTPSRLLEGRSPLELIGAGHGEAVADFADDMLTGSPS